MVVFDISFMDGVQIQQLNNKETHVDLGVLKAFVHVLPCIVPISVPTSLCLPG